MTRRRQTALAALALVLLGAAAYLNSFRGAFVFDDQEIVENHALRRLWPLGPILAGPRPIVDLTFALNCALDRLRPGGFHAVNLAIHLLAALALFGILRRTLDGMDKQPWTNHPGPTPADPHDVRQTFSLIAAAIALLWLLHPLQTESVTYISQRAESLMGLFYLFTLYCFIRSAAADGPHKFYWAGLAAAACALGMGCKQVMVTAPVAVLLYDRTFIAGTFRETLRRRWPLYLALAATWLILAPSVLAAFSPSPASAGFAVPGLTALDYARSQPAVILHYLRLAFWPSGLCLDYDWPARSVSLATIAILALLAATLWALVRRPAWGFLGAWFFLTLAPTSSLLPIQDLACEHRMYLALAAPVAAAVIAAYLVGTRLFRRRTCALAVALVLLSCAAAALAGLTVLRNADYQSAISIWKDTAKKRPLNPRAWNYLGAAYAADGLAGDAVRSCDRAIEINPHYADAYNNRAVACGRLGRWDLALRDFDQAILLKPDYAPNYYNRGKAFAALNRRDKAIADYTEAIRLNPDYAQAWHSRGNAYGRLGRLGDAVHDFTRAIELQPDFAEAYNDRAAARYLLKDYSGALADAHAAEKWGVEPPPGLLEALTRAARQPPRK